MPLTAEDWGTVFLQYQSLAMFYAPILLVTIMITNLNASSQRRDTLLHVWLLSRRT